MTSLALPPLPKLPESNECLGQQITLLAGQISAAEHRLLTLIAQFDKNREWSCGGTVRSCAHWLNWKCGITMGVAREKVRVAHCLEELPLTDRSFGSGEISYSKVRAITRVATPDNEDFLLTIARYGTASHLEQVVKKYKKVQASDDRKQEQHQQRDRKLVYFQDDDGMWVIHAKLPPEVGSLVVKTLEAVTTTLQQEKPQLEKDVPAETFSDEDLIENTRADALVTLAEHFLATAEKKHQFKGLKGSERCQVMLHVNINNLQHCHLDDNQWISPNNAKRLSCDASLITVLEDEQGRVLNIGRRSRTVPPSISRALQLRDKTCRFPGCCESRYVEAHHIKHWADGGETSLDNLVTLCRFHHRQLHSGIFSISATRKHNAQQLTFFNSSGEEIENNYFPQFPDVPAETSLLELGQLAPQVHANTCVSKWQGERIDYGMAVDGLLRRDGG